MDAFEKDETAGLIITGAKDPVSADHRAEAFCSGGYFSLDGTAGVSEDIRSQFDYSDIEGAKLILKMWQCYRPVIAAAKELFIGAGFTMCPWFKL